MWDEIHPLVNAIKLNQISSYELYLIVIGSMIVQTLVGDSIPHSDFIATCVDDRLYSPLPHLGNIIAGCSVSPSYVYH